MSVLATDTKPIARTGAPESPPQARLAWQQIASTVEPFLQTVRQRLADQIRAFDAGIAPYAEYALSNQGKQLRPALLALSARATGQLTDAHVWSAVIIELVHLATLVHDDVVDEAAVRRSRPTLAAQWGNEISVLLGDCLFAHALKLAASFPTPEICRAVAAATNTVCTGEILQTQRRQQVELTQAEYFRILQMKTGELFALSCDLGAYLSGAGKVERTALRQYGLAVGTAYQLYDDCLDLFGSEAAAGKSLGTDLAKGKLTLPVLVLLERVSPAQRAKLQELVQAWQPAAWPKVMKLLRRYHTLEAASQAIAQYLQTARQALGLLPESESRTALEGLTVCLQQQLDALAAEN
jgi:octaprenyl-diphosphate synthase